jgi:hypothetical protein
MWNLVWEPAHISVLGNLACTYIGMWCIVHYCVCVLYCIVHYIQYVIYTVLYTTVCVYCTVLYTTYSMWFILYCTLLCVYCSVTEKVASSRSNPHAIFHQCPMRPFWGYHPSSVVLGGILWQPGPNWRAEDRLYWRPMKIGYLICWK